MISETIDYTSFEGCFSLQRDRTEQWICQRDSFKTVLRCRQKFWRRRMCVLWNGKHLVFIFVWKKIDNLILIFFFWTFLWPIFVFFPFQLWEISAQNYNMASLDLGLSMVPLCGTLLAHKTTQQITDLVVHIMVHGKTKSRWVYTGKQKKTEFGRYILGY